MITFPLVDQLGDVALPAQAAIGQHHQPGDLGGHEALHALQIGGRDREVAVGDLELAPAQVLAQQERIVTAAR